MTKIGSTFDISSLTMSRIIHLTVHQFIQQLKHRISSIYNINFPTNKLIPFLRHTSRPTIFSSVIPPSVQEIKCNRRGGPLFKFDCPRIIFSPAGISGGGGGGGEINRKTQLSRVPRGRLK